MLSLVCLKADVLWGVDLRGWLRPRAFGDCDGVSSTRGFNLSVADGSRALIKRLPWLRPSLFSVLLRFCVGLSSLFAIKGRYFGGPQSFDVSSRPVIFEVGGWWWDVRSGYVCSGESTDEGWRARQSVLPVALVVKTLSLEAEQEFSDWILL